MQGIINPTEYNLSIIISICALPVSARRAYILLKPAGRLIIAHHHGPNFNDYLSLRMISPMLSLQQLSERLTPTQGNQVRVSVWLGYSYVSKVISYP